MEPLLSPEPVNATRIVRMGYLLYSLLAVAVSLLAGLTMASFAPSFAPVTSLIVGAPTALFGTWQMSRIESAVARWATFDEAQRR